MFVHACYTLLMVLIAGLSALAQTRPDSLKAEILKAKDDTNKVNLYLALTNELHLVNADSAFPNAQKALALSRQLGFVKGEAFALDDIGNYFNGRGNYAAALRSFISSLGLFEKLGRKRNMAIVCNSIGNTYLGTGDDAKALEYYQKSHDIAAEIKNRYGIGLADVGISSVYTRQGRHAPALSALGEAHAVFSELKMNYPLAVVLTNIGTIYSDTDRGDSALYFFNKAIALFSAMQNKYGTYSNMRSMGHVYFKRGEVNKALQYFTEALSLCREDNAKDNEKEIAKDVSDAYKALGRYQEAYSYFVQYAALKDSVFNSESNKQLLDVQTKYETEKKDREIVLLNKDRELQEQARHRDRLIIWFSVGGLLVVGIACVIAFLGYKRKKKLSRILELQKSIIEEKNKDITDSIRYAKNIQEAILPEVSLLDEAFREYFIFYKPKDIVSGDFYWVTHRKEKVYFAAVDCTGHGVPGAFMSMIGNTLLNDIVNDKQVSVPSDILFSLREGVIKSLKQKGQEGENKDGMDIALCCLHKNGRLEFSGANNPCWIVRGEECMEFKGDKQPIGIYSGEAQAYHTHSTQLQKDDVVYVFTDGFADQFGGEKGKKFKYKKLKELLIGIRNLSMSQQRDAIMNAYENWRGQLEQVDDVLVMGIRV
jgi:serine phosphatase RsbU (regulator of sigma subunit)